MRILKYPDPALLVPSQKIPEGLFESGELEEGIKAVKQFLTENKKNKGSVVALSAIQMGIKYAFFVLAQGLEVFCNPEIKEFLGKEYTTYEGCASLEDGKLYEVKRYPGVVLRYQRKNGKLTVKRITGFKAQIIQHEYQHIIGQLINGAGHDNITIQKDKM